MIRNLNSPSADSAENEALLTNFFPSELGWMGILGHAQIVSGVVIGHPSLASARQAARRSIKAMESVASPNLQEEDWLPELRQMLQEYARGSRVDFGVFQLWLPLQTPFRDKVLAATRALKYGQTTTYGDLARRVGHPRAARAVGTTMATNRFPILIPCHRVLAAGGKLGGYTSPAGTDLKQRLLDMEQSA